jgi:hypothetical protein
MHRPGARGLLGIALAVALLGISPAVAIADTWYAAPAGAGTDCTQPSPCPLKDAVETKAQNGDEVVVLPGNYSLETSGLLVSKDIDVHGVSAQQRPRITIDAPVGVTVIDSGAELRDLEIIHLGSQTALNATSITAERLYVSTDGGLACGMGGGLLRDSACFNLSNGDATALPPLGRPWFSAWSISRPWQPQMSVCASRGPAASTSQSMPRT